MASGHSDPFHHVRDVPYFELPQFLTDLLPPGATHLPAGLTKFMVLQVVAAVLAGLVMWGLARRVAGGKAVHGRFWNFWEAIALFIRDEVVRPTIGDPHAHDHHDDHHGHGDSGGHEHAAPAANGHPALAGAAAVAVGHPADRYLPFIWSVFFYVLFCNLLGAIPWLGSATGNMNVAAPLALTVFVAVLVAGIARSGFAGFWKSLVPSMELPGAIGVVLLPMIWFIEFAGLLIKHAVLAVRLFANMMAGHTVLGVILGFIAQTADYGFLWYAVTPVSIVAQVFIGLLELFVAFLQAYVFAFLASLFIGTAVNPH